ncbi:hypothetical protein KKG83_00510 [Candidatus Micrarchaeota archaeon]|nr:hypothetical protein [Candidatus Micrarchaeota archaeon]MBU2475933.1 hypothetical protein [Candidatus Micrarchaeota archaeon]
MSGVRSNPSLRPKINSLTRSLQRKGFFVKKPLSSSKAQAIKILLMVYPGIPNKMIKSKLEEFGIRDIPAGQVRLERFRLIRKGKIFVGKHSKFNTLEARIRKELIKSKGTKTFAEIARETNASRGHVMDVKTKMKKESKELEKQGLKGFDVKLRDERKDFKGKSSK